MREHRRRRRALFAVLAGSAALVAAQVGFRAPARASSAVAAGTAAADAALVGVVPQASSLSLTTSAGQSEAAYNQNEDQATSATVDMGGLGVLLENSPVCGQVFFTQQRQPQPLTADSQDGSRTLTNKPPSGNQVGNESVTVSSSPEYARATTAPVGQQIPGVLQVTGQTDTTVRYLTGTEQEADADVRADVTLLGGLVKMHGLRWQASMQSGVKKSSAATFSFGSVTVAPFGVPVALPASDSTAQVADAVNKVLSTFGITLEPPTSSSDPSSGSLSITPLDLHFSGSPTDNAALAPVAAQVPNVEQLLASQTSAGSDCSQIKNFLGNMLTPSEQVINLALAAAQGSGGLDIDLGGATVATQAAPQFANPFGSGGDTLAGNTPLPGTTGNGLGAGSGSSGGSPVGSSATAGGAAGNGNGNGAGAGTGNGTGNGTGLAGTGTGAGSPGGPAGSSPGRSPASARQSGNGGSLIRCVTDSPAGGGCWAGLGVLAGAGALAVGVTLLAADLGLTSLPGRRRSAKRRRKVAT